MSSPLARLNEDGEGFVPHLSTATRARNIPRFKAARVFPHLHHTEINRRVHTALDFIFGDRAHKAKLAAKAANSNPRAAKQWFARENGMSLAAFINMARQVPEFRAEARRLMEMEADSDPEFERAFAAFWRAWQESRK
jgi:hypothetical protein